VKKIYLEIVVFMCGAVVMAFEIIGSRMLGPYVGTSYVVWSAIIGIILLSLSLGYFTGGRLADRKPKPDVLSLIIFMASLFILGTALVKDPLLTFLLNIVESVKVVSVLSSALLFVPAAFLLGMVSPFAARLKMHSVAYSGRTVGNLYALSTMGSIAGVFLAGFYLIPAFRITTILYLFAALLAMVSLLIISVHPKTPEVADDKKTV
jgi:MFS family permease